MNQVPNNRKGLLPEFCRDQFELLKLKGFQKVLADEMPWENIRDAIILGVIEEEYGCLKETILLDVSTTEMILKWDYWRWNPRMVELGDNPYLDFRMMTDQGLKSIAHYFPATNTLFAAGLHISTIGVFLLKLILGWLPSREAKQYLPVSIGLDAELECFNDDGQLIPADEVFMDKKRLIPVRPLDEVDKLHIEKFGLDLTESYALIGTDDEGQAVEFRPFPSLKAATVVQYVKLLIWYFNKHFKKHLSVKGDHYALGCHLHFGFGFPFYPDAKLLFLLDYFIGKVVIEKSGQARGEYKKLGQFIAKAHGFEYRTCPSAILEKPEYLNVVLLIAHMVVERYVNGEMFEIAGDTQATDEEYRECCLLTEEELRIFNNFQDHIVSDGNIITNWL
jgi:hypothetical protein